ncbi:hypothetical protein [Massilia sp. CF038]|uniref:hypothetical protein n=1 Tax=Massilia sp. CF038 TaxID=1881045 RepID=UPI00092334EF|nr:hypothetical protein [Massilia sp. CF038]SHH01441.1 hypothetical protein SAMN05428948_2328 [Massilia sp. CF038]
MQQRLAQFARLQQAAPALYTAFNGLTRAHGYFQGAAGLRSISVSDILSNGSIEATFQGVRIKFEALLIQGTDRSPRMRVICMQCHCTYGKPVQEMLGSFSYGEDGVTDLDPDRDGMSPRIDSEAPDILLHFLDAAIQANKSI